MEPGSKTRLSHLVNYKLHHPDGSLEFIGSSIPKQGETISALIPELHLQNLLGLHYQAEQTFTVVSRNKKTTETWKVELDLWGNWQIVSSRGTQLGFSVYNGVFNTLFLNGNRKSALAAFARLVSRLPYSEKQELVLKDEPALSVITNPALRHLLLLLSPLFTVVTGCTETKTGNTKDRINIHSITSYRVFGIKMKEDSGNLVINKYEGVAELSLTRNGKACLKATNNTIGVSSP